MDHETITKLAEQEEAGSSGANFLPFLTGKPACHLQYSVMRRMLSASSTCFMWCQALDLLQLMFHLMCAASCGL